MLNPSQILSQAMRNTNLASNPRARRVLEAYRNHDHNALVEIGNNIFKENGMTLDEATRQFMNRAKMF